MTDNTAAKPAGLATGVLPHASAYFHHRLAQAAVIGIGAGAMMTLMQLISDESGYGLCWAALAASAFLIAALPETAMAHPRAVVFGHLIAAACGIGAAAYLPAGPVALGAAVALAVALTIMTRTVHAPAIATVYASWTAKAPWAFLLHPVLGGTIAVVVLGIIFNRLVRRYPYPRHWLRHH